MMTDPREPQLGQSKPLDRPRTRSEVEHFEHELAFLDSASALVDTLKKYSNPTRKVHVFEIPGMGRTSFNYPISLDKQFGEIDYESIQISIIEEEDRSATIIELVTPRGTIYIARDSIITDEEVDYILDDKKEPRTILKVPNGEINDFLHSITQRGNNPAAERFMKNVDTLGSKELVRGELMRAALEDSATHTATYYTYELEDERKVWFSLDGNLSDEKLISVTIHYKDFDMNDCTADIDLSQGLAIKFKHTDATYGDTSPIYPDDRDYSIALRVMREETQKLMQPYKGRHVEGHVADFTELIDGLTDDQS